MWNPPILMNSDILTPEIRDFEPGGRFHNGFWQILTSRPNLGSPENPNQLCVPDHKIRDFELNGGFTVSFDEFWHPDP